MAAVHGFLGQKAPAAGVTVVAYQVPRGKRAEIQIVVTNRSAIADSFSVAVSPGNSLTDSHYVAFDEAIEANESLVSVPIRVSSKDNDANDLVRVRSTNGTVSFNVNGVEETDT